MKINSINNNQTNTNFNAKVKFDGVKLEHISDAKLENLTNKAKSIGTEKDLITFGVNSQGSVKDLISGSIIGFFNRINVGYSLNSLKNKQEENSMYKIYGETEKSCDEKTFDFFDKYINSVKNSYEKADK